MPAPRITTERAAQWLTLAAWASSLNIGDWITSAASKAADVTTDADPAAHLSTIETAAVDIGAHVVHAEAALDAAEVDADRRERIAALLAEATRHGALSHRAALQAAPVLAGEEVQ